LKVNERSVSGEKVSLMLNELKVGSFDLAYPDPSHISFHNEIMNIYLNASLIFAQQKSVKGKIIFLTNK